MNRKRFGFGHSSLVKPGPGNLALFCAACPQPGINMPLHWRHKYPRQVIYLFHDWLLYLSLSWLAPLLCVAYMFWPVMLYWFDWLASMTPTCGKFHPAGHA